MSARVAALANNVKLGDLQTWKAETTFEMMSSYAMVNQRVRFLKGFDETALAYLNTQLFSVMGEKGIAHRKFPLGHAILMSPDLLLSSAFMRAKDIEQVPAWRDGGRGQELQRKMVGVAAKRYFEYGFAESNKPLFASAATWVAFTRLLSSVEVCQE